MSRAAARGRRGRPVAGPAGFTLLEVLVALAILSFAVVAVIQGFAQGLRLLKLSGDHQQAMLLADQKTREVVDPAQQPEQDSGGAEGDFRWERTTRLLEAPDLAPAGTPPHWRVYEIAVRVSWDQRRQVELTTLRTVPIKTVATTRGPGTTGSPGTTPGAAVTTPGTSPFRSAPGTTTPGVPIPRLAPPTTRSPGRP